jgi:hypothetical membrane protein
MSPQNVVEFADRISRRRALGTALATIVFLAIQVVVRPVFRTDGYAASDLGAHMWALNAALLLLLLLPAGGFVWGRRVRTLVNDEVSRNNSRTAMAAGFWVAMVIALGLYALPASRGFNAREAIYLIATPTTGVALLAFAWLESRAHRGG